MSFLKSAINQVGRDLGKVLSNQLFNDSHSTPLRMVGKSASSQNKISKTTKSEFEKAIDFQIAHRPSTLISKLFGCYTVLKNEASVALADGYLDNEESQEFFTMLSLFSNKVENVNEALELDNAKNVSELNQLEKIVDNLKQLIAETMSLSIEGCKLSREKYIKRIEGKEGIGFWRYVGLNMIWMRNYARGGEKKPLNAVIANIISLIGFPVIQIILGIDAAISYNNDKKKEEKLKGALTSLASLELERIEIYEKVIENLK